MNSGDVACERRWYYFLTSSVAPYFGVLGFLLLVRLMYVRRQRLTGRAVTLRSAIIARHVVSLKSPVGKVLAAVGIAFSLGSFIVYVRETVRTSDSPFLVERCGVYNDGWFIADVIFNLYFMIYFILRFLAATDKLIFWIKASTIIDFATVPPIILSLVLDQLWIGLRFFRAFRLLELPKLLEAWKLIKSRKVLQTIDPMMTLITLWIVGAGFVHLLENSGDPWEFDESADKLIRQNWNYFECLYMIAVTLSTVGYGDYFAITYLGRVFMIFFIVGGLALFASYVPAIVDYIGQRNKYAGIYKRVTKYHIVVCGHVTTNSMETLLQDFFHEDRNEEGKTTVVFLDHDQPDTKMKSVLRYYTPEAEYYEGSALNSTDLKRVQLASASACIILADKNSHDPDQEDSENLMRAVSVKNYCQDMRVIMQILLQRNKKLLESIPNFQPDKSDDVICVNEFKLSMIAQSCMCPGFSTLIANIIGIRSSPDEVPWSFSSVADENWKTSYFYGCSYDFYPAPLSEAFTGMTFQQVVEICYTKLNMLLLGVETGPDAKVYVNPSKDNFVVTDGSKGFFLAQDKDDTESATYYTTEGSFLKGALTLKPIKSRKRRNYELTNGDQMASENAAFTLVNPLAEARESEEAKLLADSVDDTTTGAVDDISIDEFQIDQTKSYYQQEFVEFEDALLNSPESVQHGHVVVCVFGDESSNLIGLQNLLIPLRAASLSMSELKQVVFVGNDSYLKREWPNVGHFSSVKLICGSGLEKEDLRRASVNTCSMCVFISAGGHRGTSSSDVYLIDKECVLGTLTLKTMTFAKREDGRGVLRGIDVPILTDLGNDSNVEFLDQTDEDDPNASLFETQAFALGNAISSSIVDSAVSSVYADCNTMTLLGMLLNLGGGHTRGSGGGQDLYCRVVQKPITDPPFNQYRKGSYGDMFISVLQKAGMLCLGLYRRFQPQPDSPLRRYVITSPLYDFRLMDDDLVFVLLPPVVEPEMSTI